MPSAKVEASAWTCVGGCQHSISVFFTSDVIPGQFIPLGCSTLTSSRLDAWPSEVASQALKSRVLSAEFSEAKLGRPEGDRIFCCYHNSRLINSCTLLRKYVVLWTSIKYNRQFLFFCKIVFQV